MIDFPEGYTSKPSDDKEGFNVFSPSDEQINIRPIRNLFLAQMAALDHLTNNKVGEDFFKFTRSELDEVAAKRNVDISKARNPSEAISIIITPAALSKRKKQ